MTSSVVQISRVPVGHPAQPSEISSTAIRRYWVRYGQLLPSGPKRWSPSDECQAGMLRVVGNSLHRRRCENPWKCAGCIHGCAGGSELRTAVNPDGIAGDPTSIVRGEKSDDRPNIDRFADALQRLH